jgi:hypothetical protein
VLLGLGCFIFLVWAIATLGGQFTGKPVDTEVHVIALTVATGLFGGAAIAGRKSNGNGRGGDPGA